MAACAATRDGMRRRAIGRGLITPRQAAGVARVNGLDVTAAEVAAMCEDWPGEFEAFPSVPWSEAQYYDGWEWCIVANDFRSWCEWEAARDDSEG